MEGLDKGARRNESKLLFKLDFQCFQDDVSLSEDEKIIENVCIIRILCKSIGTWTQIKERVAVKHSRIIADAWFRFIAESLEVWRMFLWQSAVLCNESEIGMVVHCLMTVDGLFGEEFIFVANSKS